MQQESQDRNLPASERKLKKARQEGQVTRSEDLKHIAVLGVGAFAAVVLAPPLFDQFRLSMSQQLSFDAATLQQANTMVSRLGSASAIGIAVCVAFAAIVGAAVIAANVSSGGWVSSLKPLMPDFSRLNPLSGFANLFTKKKLLATVKTALLTAILLAIAANFLSSDLQTIAALLMQPSSGALTYLGQWLASGMGLMLLVVLLFAMVDVPLQKFLHRDEMKMSHQEFKEEGKESDGNPLMKGKIRQRQRDLAQKGSVNAVTKADFVVMNPTHFAVAIRYDEKTMQAPQVISKGADLLAMKIRDLAKSHSIPVLQSPMLARALYANAELNQDIPAALYTAVAQVLAYVYKLRSALRGAGPMPIEVPQPVVPPELDPLTKTTRARAL